MKILFLLLVIASCGPGNVSKTPQSAREPGKCESAFVTERDFLVREINLVLITWEDDKSKIEETLSKTDEFLERYPNIRCQALMLDCDKNSPPECSLRAPWVEKTLDNSDVQSARESLQRKLQQLNQ